MGTRLFGLEAELAVCAVRDGQALPGSVVVEALERLARTRLVHLPGFGSRMFLANGGLFYVDCGNHPEICTPEVTSPADAVSYLRAGERMVAGLASLARDQLQADSVVVYRSNVDYESGATWGCHESYLGHRPIESYRSWLIPHLVSRIALTGSGGLDPLSPGIRLSISPRVAYIDHVVSSASTEGRGIFHMRDEPLCKGYSRVHVLAGDNACSHRATWLKTGTTALVVALVDSENADKPCLELLNPVAAMKGFARDLGWRTPVRSKRGFHELMTAVDIQRHLLRSVEAALGQSHFPDWAPAVCEAWKHALDVIESPVAEASHAFDWPLKFALFRREVARRGFTERSISAWSLALEKLSRPAPPECGQALNLDQARIDLLRSKGILCSADLDEAGRVLEAHGLSWQGLDEFAALRRQLCAIDMRFGELDGGIFDSLDRQGVIPAHRMLSDAQISAAAAGAPIGSRAAVRGHWIERLAHLHGNFQCDWSGIFGAGEHLDLRDPFATAGRWQRTRQREQSGEYPDGERSPFRRPPAQ